MEGVVPALWGSGDHFMHLSYVYLLVFMFVFATKVFKQLRSSNWIIEIEGRRGRKAKDVRVKATIEIHFSFIGDENSICVISF